MSLRPYLAGFRLAISHELVHRTNFLIGRLREFIFFAALLLLFKNLPEGVGLWSQAGLFTYTLLSAFVSTQLAAQGMNQIASEIADGDLTNFLLRPMSYLGYWTARLMAVRLLSALSGGLAVGILLFIFRDITLTLPSSALTWIAALGLFLGSVILMQLIDFLAGLLSFWTDRAYGPRFLTLILIQFLSGAYLPIDTLPAWTQRLLQATPFPSLVYAPVTTFVAGVGPQTLEAFRTQWIWIGVLGGCLGLVWKRGLKTYAAYGR